VQHPDFPKFRSDETIYAEAQKMLDENWRPYVHDPMEWAIRDGGLFRRPWLLDETKQVVKKSADYLLRIGYIYVSLGIGN
jgi:hypothetical protein